MILWSTKKDGPWTAFQSVTKTSDILLRLSTPLAKWKLENPQDRWFPLTCIRESDIQKEAESQIIYSALLSKYEDSESKGRPDVEPFEQDKRSIVDLLKLGEFYICGARPRTLLDPGDERIRWSTEQKVELGNLRKLLHPRWLAADGGELEDEARVVQAVFYATKEKLELTAIERAVLWQMSHLYPILSFCELIVALGFPNQDSEEAPSALGASIAAKSALELTAHFVVGGTKKFDPFDDATAFKYSEAIDGLGERPDWKDACGWYDELSDVIKLKKPVNEKILKTCKSVLQLVCKTEFQQSVTASDGTIVLMKFGAEDFTAPKGDYAVLTYRTNFDPCPWPLSADTIDCSMSWSGIYSPRLEELGYTKVDVFDSPNLVDSADLLLRLEGFKTDDAETPKVVAAATAAISLIRAFCICYNLGNILALGAIARELHLVVENFTELRGLAAKRDDKELEKVKKENGQDSEEYKELKEKEDDKSLNCIASDIPKLNTFRTRLQDILASFAHPGWLIRTELLRDKEDKDSSTQALFITSNYSPNFMGRVELHDGNRTSVELIPINLSAVSHFSQVIMNFPEDLRVALTGDPECAIKSGEAIDVPFVAFNLCRRALSMNIPPKLLLAYIFHADAPQALADGCEDWFSAFPDRAGSTLDKAKLEHLGSYVDNTYFFSRSCREYVFPEIVALEDEILQSKPSILDESKLFKTFETTGELSNSIAERWMKVRESRVVPDDRRLRRFLVSRISGIDRGPDGWMLTGTLGGEWEHTVNSIDIHLLDIEVQLYAANVGVVLLTLGLTEDKLDDKVYLKNLAAVTKDVLPPNTYLPAAELSFPSGSSDEKSSWLKILEEATDPFRRGDTPNARSLFTPANQEFGQYFRRFWYLHEHNMKEAFNIVRVNYLQPFEREETGVKTPIETPILKAPDEVFKIDEGWEGLVHHHEFVISRDSQQVDKRTRWWYQKVFVNVVTEDYSWLWLLAIVQRVRLGRLLADLDVSAPADAEVELQNFYDFMQQENFGIPSTQPVGNLLARKLNESTDVDEMIAQIEREAGVIRESVLARSARVQQAALVVIALLGTWLSLGALADEKGKFDMGWFAQRNIWLALPVIAAVYLLCRAYLLRRRRRIPRQR